MPQKVPELFFCGLKNSAPVFPSLKFWRIQIASVFVVFLLSFYSVAFGTNTVTGLLPDFWFPVEAQIRSGDLLTGIAIQSLQVLCSRFDPEEIDYLKKILNLITQKKYLIIQEYRVEPSNRHERFKIRVYCPAAVFPFQKIMWQGQTSNARDFLRENHYFIFASEPRKETRIKICSILSCKPFDFGYSNFILPPNTTRNSFTREISKKFNVLSDIADFMGFFGTFAPNGDLLPIQYILLNPINIDCTEYSTLAFEFLSDKGLDVRYSLGIMASNYQSNHGGFHCWNSIFFNGERIEIDPTLGRKIGRLAYHWHFPIQINFTDFASLEELSSFPIGFASLNGVDLKCSIGYNSRLTVYELNF